MRYQILLRLAEEILKIDGLKDHSIKFESSLNVKMTHRDSAAISVGSIDLLKTTGHRLSPLSAFLEALSTSVKSLSKSSF
jgi:hypothetical protein